MKFACPGHITRRDATKLLSAALLSRSVPLSFAHAQTSSQQSNPAESWPTEADIDFLDEMQRAACLYFTEQVDAASGQVLDRALNQNPTGVRDSRFVSSIAATGFGLAALCIAEKRRYITTAQSRRQVLATLRFHFNKLHHEYGCFYHFNNVETGEPAINSEISPMDTAIFLCGVLTCRAHFRDPEIARLATQLYERVEWPWMLNTGMTFSKGWRPDIGFIYSRWDHYSELMMMYLLAIGSPRHPIGADHWSSFTRPRMEFREYQYISGHDPLCVHQLLHELRDRHTRPQSFLSQPQPRLHRGLLGHLRIRLGTWLHSLGRPSAHGSCRWVCNTISHIRITSLSSQRVPPRSTIHEGNLRGKRMGTIRLLRFIPSSFVLVRPRCAWHRPGNRSTDG